MLWNANGLPKHQQELEMILKSEKIDICLIAETHFTNQTCFKIKNFETYHTIHPSNSAQGGSAVIIRSNIKHYEQEKVSTNEFQATTITINAGGDLALTAVYSPPRHQIKCDQYVHLIERHKTKFIMGGDFNAKHIHWGSRLTTTKGRELFKALQQTNCNTASSWMPTYWPSDPQKNPDLIDFFITRKVSSAYLNIENGLDMNSDHSPIYLTLSETVVLRDPVLKLTSQFTDWDYFRKMLEESQDNTFPMESTTKIDDEVLKLTREIQHSAWSSTPPLMKISAGHKYTKDIKEMVLKKRKMRRRWHQTRSPVDKAALNKAAKDLSHKIKEYKNQSFTNYAQQLNNKRDTNYSLWKCTKKLKQTANHNPPIKVDNNGWAKTNTEKANIFSDYLAKIFTPNSDTSPILNNDGIANDNYGDIVPITEDEMCAEIQKLKSKKSPGFDLITAEVLKQVPRNIITKLTNIMNACFKLQYFPIYWKIADVIMVLKPGKPPNDVASYRPISLLPILSKLLEKFLIKRLSNIIENKQIIPTHQFGFRAHHSTIDQIHRITRIIENTFEEKNVCSAVFLDVSKAFDKVCHAGLLWKIKNVLPTKCFNILKTYLSERYFRVRYEDEFSELKEIKAGVPQGSVLGPLLYLLFTHDLPNSRNCFTATFADDTAILTVGKTEIESTTQLQLAINKIYNWTDKWHIKLNETKSVHINFTNKKTNYLPIYINSIKVPYSNTAKYLGMTLDTKLRWSAHVKKKREELDLKFQNMRWLMGKQSALSAHNKILLYKQILKPIWTYGIQLWGCTSYSNTAHIQRFQTKALKHAVCAPWYIRTQDLERDLNIDSVTATIKKFAKSHAERLSKHVNNEALILNDNTKWKRRLKRKKPLDLN